MLTANCLGGVEVGRPLRSCTVVIASFFTKILTRRFSTFGLSKKLEKLVMRRVLVESVIKARVAGRVRIEASGALEAVQQRPSLRVTVVDALAKEEIELAV